MKKLLNISVIAALAILPMAANAEVYQVNDPLNDPNAAAAQTDPKWALAEAGGNDGNLATAGYVKGAYNQTMKAINAVATTANSAVKGVQVNGTDLTLDANGKANVTVAEGTTNGTVAVNGADVSVHGLGSAAYTDSTAYISSDAGAVKTANIDNRQVTKEKLAQAVQNSLDAADSAVQSVVEGSTNGTVSVDGTDVAVHGLGSAAYVNTGDLASTANTYNDTNSNLGATTIQGAIEALDTAVDTMNASSADYAKKIGVTHTISKSTIAGTVPTVTVWGADTPGTAPITASITGATYTETAPANP